MGGHGRSGRPAADRHPSRHRLRGRHGRAGGRPWSSAGVAYETSDGVYLDGRPGARATGCWPASPSIAAGRGAGGGRRGEALAPRLRAVEEGQAGRAHLGLALGPGPPGWHTECVVMSLDLLGDGLRPPRRRAATWPSPTTRTSGPRRWPSGAPSPATGSTTAGWRSAGRRCPSRSATSPRSPTCSSERRPGLPPAGPALPLPLAHRGDRRDTVADAEEGLERLDALARRFSLPDVLAEVRAGRWWPAAGPAAEASTRRPWPSFVERMDDDLDTPGALAGVFELVSRANAAADAGDADRRRPAGRARWPCCAAPSGSPSRRGRRRSTPGGRAWPPSATRPGPGRDWARADALRDELVGPGLDGRGRPRGHRLRH